MSKLIDETGNKHGRLTVVKRLENDKNNRAKFLCICDCGGIVHASGKLLRNGSLRSCGCLLPEVTVKRCTTHGFANKGKAERLYKVWLSMKNRVLNKNNVRGYKYYGGRGITICEEWTKDYLVFRKWALENGYNETLPRGKCTIDRIDTNGNYEPGNCRWVDMKVQAKNQRKRYSANEIAGT